MAISSILPIRQRCSIILYRMDCRLQYAQELQVWLQKEIDQRTILYNRYKCHTNTIDYIILGSQFVSVIASASGVGVLTTIVAAPIAIALGTVAAVFGGLSMASKVASRRFTMKAKNMMISVF